MKPMSNETEQEAATFKRRLRQLKKNLQPFCAITQQMNALAPTDTSLAGVPRDYVNVTIHTVREPKNTHLSSFYILRSQFKTQSNEI